MWKGNASASRRRDRRMKEIITSSAYRYCTHWLPVIVYHTRHHTHTHRRNAKDINHWAFQPFNLVCSDDDDDEPEEPKAKSSFSPSPSANEIVDVGETLRMPKIIIIYCHKFYGTFKHFIPMSPFRVNISSMNRTMLAVRMLRHGHWHVIEIVSLCFVIWLNSLFLELHRTCIYYSSYQEMRNKYYWVEYYYYTSAHSTRVDMWNAAVH